MSSELDALLEQIAVLDPDKAAHLRWIRPQASEATLVELATDFLATRAQQDQMGGNPNATLLDLGMGLDPDEPTVRLPPGAEDDQAAMTDDDDSR